MSLARYLYPNGRELWFATVSMTKLLVRAPLANFYES
jgi:hypothetical protein